MYYNACLASHDNRLEHRRQSYGNSLEYPPNYSRLTQQNLKIKELEVNRRRKLDRRECSFLV